jgi:hypothetical protein
MYGPSGQVNSLASGIVTMIVGEGNEFLFPGYVFGGRLEFCSYDDSPLAM